MESKRVKVSFETINKDNYSIISRKAIYESNQRIKNEMKKIIKNIKKMR